MPTLTVYASTADNEAWYTSAGTPSFGSMKNAAAGTAAGTVSAVDARIGYDNSGSPYYLSQFFTSFDLSGLPDYCGYTGTQTMSLWVVTAPAASEFCTFVKDWGPAVAAADWCNATACADLTKVGTVAHTGLTAGAYRAFCANTDELRAALQSVGSGVLWLMTSLNLAQTNGQHVHVSAADGAGTTQDPKLDVEYVALSSRAFGVCSEQRQKNTASFAILPMSHHDTTLVADDMPPMVCYSYWEDGVAPSALVPIAGRTVRLVGNVFYVPLTAAELNHGHVLLVPYHTRLAGDAVLIETYLATGLSDVAADASAAATDSAAAHASADTLLTDVTSIDTSVEMVRKLLCNKWVENGTGDTITVYEDDSSTPYATISWNAATRTRGKLT